ncbi:MAG: signal recognition particle receptor subunit alpha, partial [Burkholderiales bacterium]|nr:signal recognition particle receptor subunit alpha [Burkholderiales bacterium]
MRLFDGKGRGWRHNVENDLSGLHRARLPRPLSVARPRPGACGGGSPRCLLETASPHVQLLPQENRVGLPVGDAAHAGRRADGRAAGVRLGIRARAPAPVQAPATVQAPVPAPAPEVVSAPLDFLKRVFTGSPPPAPAAPIAPQPAAPAVPVVPVAQAPEPAPEVPRDAWFQRLRKGLARTGSGIAQVFTGARIDDELYEELESALLMADAGVRATKHLLKDLKQRVKAAGSTEPAQVKALLADAIVDLLAPLERSLMVGEHQPTVIMVAGVNGAGKTTSIGKLTRHLAEAKCKVLLAAADTFR